MSTRALQQRRDVMRAKIVKTKVATENGYTIGYAKIVYPPGTPKDAPRWVWKCFCDQCRDLPPPQGIHGPFKTRREAEADFVQVAQFVDRPAEGSA
jgi:hypothetical protein